MPDRRLEVPNAPRRAALLVAHLVELPLGSVLIFKSCRSWCPLRLVGRQASAAGPSTPRAPSVAAASARPAPR